MAERAQLAWRARLVLVGVAVIGLCSLYRPGLGPDLVPAGWQIDLRLLPAEGAWWLVLLRLLAGLLSARARSPVPFFRLAAAAYALASLLIAVSSTRRLLEGLWSAVNAWGIPDLWLLLRLGLPTFAALLALWPLAAFLDRGPSPVQGGIVVFGSVIGCRLAL